MRARRAPRRARSRVFRSWLPPPEERLTSLYAAIRYSSAMTTRTLAAVTLALALGACASATVEDVNKARDSWQGASYEDVLRVWGAPARSTTTADGRYWYTWVTESSVQPSSSVGIGIGGMRIGGGGSTGVGVGMRRRLAPRSRPRAASARWCSTRAGSSTR